MWNCGHFLVRQVSELQNYSEFRPLPLGGYVEASKSSFWGLAPEPYVSCTFSLATCHFRAPGGPGAFWSSLGLSGLPGRSWALLGAPGRSWALLGAPGAPGRFWVLLGAPGRFWALLGAPGRSWALLGAPGRSWALLGAPGRSWALLGTPGATLLRASFITQHIKQL